MQFVVYLFINNTFYLNKKEKHSINGVVKISAPYDNLSFFDSFGKNLNY